MTNGYHSESLYFLFCIYAFLVFFLKFACWYQRSRHHSTVGIFVGAFLPYHYNWLSCLVCRKQAQCVSVVVPKFLHIVLIV
jgi:hypothetical protein